MDADTWAAYEEYVELENRNEELVAVIVDLRQYEFDLAA